MSLALSQSGCNQGSDSWASLGGLTLNALWTGSAPSADSSKKGEKSLQEAFSSMGEGSSRAPAGPSKCSLAGTCALQPPPRLCFSVGDGLIAGAGLKGKQTRKGRGQAQVCASLSGKTFLLPAQKVASSFHTSTALTPRPQLFLPDLSDFNEGLTSDEEFNVSPSKHLRGARSVSAGGSSRKKSCTAMQSFSGQKEDDVRKCCVVVLVFAVLSRSVRSGGAFADKAPGNYGNYEKEASAFTSLLRQGKFPALLFRNLQLRAAYCPLSFLSSNHNRFEGGDGEEKRWHHSGDRSHEEKVL